LPLKAVVLNMLSLTAAFGALVWIFQDGHLNALGTTSTGTLVANMPVLLFCIAFGLSMDYEVFLVARIREFWLKWREGDPTVAGRGAPGGGRGGPEGGTGHQRRGGRARPGPHRPRHHCGRRRDVHLVRGAH